MKTRVTAMVAALAVGASFAVASAPYEDQKMRIHRLQQAKLTGAPTSKPAGMESMHGQMPLMQEMNRQLQQARAVDRMTSGQMREWIVEHTRLMDRMQQQMMGVEPSAPSAPESVPAPAR